MVGRKLDGMEDEWKDEMTPHEGWDGYKLVAAAWFGEGGVPHSLLTYFWVLCYIWISL